MRGIEVHYEDASGTRGVINYLTGDNVELSSVKQSEQATRTAALIERAKTFAGAWSVVFPADKFFVVDMRTQWRASRE